jgi:hypothetical protein
MLAATSNSRTTRRRNHAGTLQLVVDGKLSFPATREFADRTTHSMILRSRGGLVHIVGVLLYGGHAHDGYAPRMKKQQQQQRDAKRKPRVPITERQLAMVRGGVNGDCDDPDPTQPATAIEY